MLLVEGENIEVSINGYFEGIGEFLLKTNFFKCNCELFLIHRPTVTVILIQKYCTFEVLIIHSTVHVNKLIHFFYDLLMYAIGTIW